MLADGTQRILVVGGTGMLGAPVVRRLAADGYVVRALAREPARAGGLFDDAVEIVAGDVTRPDTLPSAVDGCQGLYVSLRGNFDAGDYAAVEDRGLANLLRAAKTAGVGRVGLISGAGDTTGNERFLPVRIKLRAEAHVRDSGIPWMIFRCTHFMESLDLFVRGGKAVVIGHQPHPYHYVAAADYAAMVSRAFALNEAADCAFTILGPEALTMEQALRIYIDELAPQLKPGHVPAFALKLIGTLTRNRELIYTADLFASFTRVGESGDPGPANELLGRPRTTLREWCAARKSTVP